MEEFARQYLPLLLAQSAAGFDLYLRFKMELTSLLRRMNLHLYLVYIVYVFIVCAVSTLLFEVVASLGAIEPAGIPGMYRKASGVISVVP